MQVTITSNTLAEGLSARNEQGQSIAIGASPEVGGQNQAMRPKQMLLASLGACSAIDVLHILNKQRQSYEALFVTVTGTARAGAEPAVFERIDLHYQLRGPAAPDKLARAAQLSLERYCSVAAMLRQAAELHYTSEVLQA
jgi:putative redox protein